MEICVQSHVSGKGKDVMGKVINSLALYTIKHFGYEEKYFSRFGYPDTAAHKEEDEKFITEVTNFKKGFLKTGRLPYQIV